MTKKLFYVPLKNNDYVLTFSSNELQKSVNSYELYESNIVRRLELMIEPSKISLMNRIRGSDIKFIFL